MKALLIFLLYSLLKKTLNKNIPNKKPYSNGTALKKETIK